MGDDSSDMLAVVGHGASIHGLNSGEKQRQD
jgi:hypothetical protein